MKKLSRDALFVFEPNPLWSHSIAQIQALLLASEEGLFFEMLDKQFLLQQPGKGLNLRQIKEIAKEIGMDDALLEERMKNADYIEYIMEQRKIRRAHKITSAPTVIINGKIVHPNSKTVDCFETLIKEIE